MDFLALKDISERYIDLINPTSTEKIITMGKLAGLKAGSRVIDFGCGFGEPLALWGEQFSIQGVGIDIRAYACRRARARLAASGLAEQIKIVEGSGATYKFELHRSDLAACLGATFIFGGYRQTIQALKTAIKPGGRLMIGEPYWLSDTVPPEFAQDQAGILSEIALLQITRQEGCRLEYMVRSSSDDWDRYEASNWYGYARWLDENPEHPDRHDVIADLNKSQEEYFRYGHKYFGWAIFLLKPE